MIQFSLWCSRGIGVGSTSAAKRGHNVDKAAVVLHPSLGTTSLLLLLLLGINLEPTNRDTINKGAQIHTLSLKAPLIGIS